jgi:UDP-3-O-[3-hydroxymyristoyl] glucosamine N-acyltransferase
MSKKYELIASDFKWLYRVKALKSFSDVKAGDIGGYVAGEHNLSHGGDCWVSNNARVYGNACVYDDVRVSDNARVFGNAQVFDNAWVSAGLCI